MKKILLKSGTLLFPTIVWTVVTAIGFGPQSLANLVELVFVWIGSVVLVFVPEKFLSPKGKLFVGTILVIALRAFMPLIPE